MTAPTTVKPLESPQTRLVTDNIRLAYKVACQFHHKTSGIDIDDLKSISLLGLVKAAHSFDETKGYAFSTFATMCCMNEIRCFLRTHIHQTGKDVSMSTPIHDSSGELTLLDTIEDDTDTEDTVITPYAIHQAYLTLTSAEQQVISLRYLDHEYSQKEAAALLHVSQSHISRIEKNALNKMREQLQ